MKIKMTNGGKYENNCELYLNEC